MIFATYDYINKLNSDINFHIIYKDFKGSKFPILYNPLDLIK